MSNAPETLADLSATQRETLRSLFASRSGREFAGPEPLKVAFGPAALAVGARDRGRGVPRPEIAESRLASLAELGLIVPVELPGHPRTLYRLTERGLMFGFAAWHTTEQNFRPIPLDHDAI